MATHSSVSVCSKMLGVGLILHLMMRPVPKNCTIHLKKLLTCQIQAKDGFYINYLFGGKGGHARLHQCTHFSCLLVWTIVSSSCWEVSCAWDECGELVETLAIWQWQLICQYLFARRCLALDWSCTWWCIPCLKIADSMWTSCWSVKYKPGTAIYISYLLGGKVASMHQCLMLSC